MMQQFAENDTIITIIPNQIITQYWNSALVQ